MSRERLPSVLRRLLFQWAWGGLLLAIGLGAGEPAPQRANSARDAAPQRDSTPRRDAVRLRDPTDALHVEFNRPHLICNPQEVLRAVVWLDLADTRESNSRPSKPHLKWKLSPVGHSRSLDSGTPPVVWPADANGPAQVPIEITLPREEGVYELRLTAGARRIADFEFVVQLVVLESDRRLAPATDSRPPLAGPEKLVDSFVSGTSLSRKVPLDRLQAKPNPSWSRFLKFPPHRHGVAKPALANDAGDSHVVAYRLKVAHPGRPHRVELTVAVPAASGGADQPAVYQQIFWPSDREPIVLVECETADGPVEVNRVELYEMGERLPVARAAGFDHTSLEWKQRLVGLHLSSYELIKNFGSLPDHENDEKHAAAKRLGDDCQTTWTSAHRLTDYLHYQRHNALMLSMPLTNFAEDTATDSVELLLRLFDRDDLVLVPELAFNQRLPSIERLLRDSSELPESTSGGSGMTGDLLLVNSTGRTRTDALGSAPDGQAADETRSEKSGSHEPASYNILSPRVQQAVLESTRQFVMRYASHASFGGVSFELGHDSCLQLPDIEWGYDSETVRQFEQATHVQVPRAGRNETRQQAAYRYLTTTARREWVRWRSAEVARFHRKLAELVLAAKPDAQVFFSGRLWTAEGQAAEVAVLDFVRSGGGPAQLLNAQGLDFSLAPYSTDARVTVLRPLIQLGSNERLSQAAAASLNHSPAIDALYRVASPGGLIYSPAVEIRHPQPEFAAADDAEAGPFSEAIRPAVPLAVVPHYTHLVATLDAQAIFDGSTAVPLAPSDSTRRMRTIIESLPSLTFHAAGPQPQPLVVRAAQHGKITWIYAVNDSSLPLAVDLVFDCPAATSCRMLDGSRAPALAPVSGSAAGGNQPGATKSHLHVEMAGNDLWACRLERSAVAVIDVQLALSDTTLAEVEHRIDRLSARMRSVASQARTGSRQLPNPGFEQQGQTKELPGWELPVEQAGWALDEVNPRSGHRALVISAEANKTALATPPLVLEGNHCITTSLWLRSNKPSARVRMVFEATIDGAAFQREEPIEAGKTWQQHVFRVDALPAGPVQNARVSVRPIDSCKLWVDDVEIGVQSFNNDEVRQLTKTLSSVKLAWEAGRYADCQRLLDGYWGQLLLAEPAASPTDKPRLGDRPRNKSRR